MKETLFSTKYLELVASKRAGKADWVYARRPNAKDVVIVIPLLYRLDKVSTIFLFTKRPPLVEEYGERFCLEFPAGLVGDEIQDETVEDATNKELLEETGYKADKIEVLTNSLVSSGGMTNEKSTLCFAHIFNPKIVAAPVDDGGVIVKREEILLKNIPEFLNKTEKEGTFLSGQTLAGLYFLRNKEFLK